MKKEITIIPDKVIELSHDDKVKIYIKKNNIEFDFFCDGTGNGFSLTKNELKEMLK
jgi:hypothetical protein